MRSTALHVLLWLVQEPLPEPGGLTSLPPVRTTTVALANPGFDDRQTGWSFGRSAGAFAAVDDPSAAGGRCLGYTPTGTRTYPSVFQNVSGIVPGVYILRFRVKTEGMGPVDTANGAGGVRVQALYTSRTGIQRRASSRIFGGTFDWRDEDVWVQIGDDLQGDTLTIAVHQYPHVGKGQARLDGFALERVVPAAVEAFLLYPNFRGYLPEDGPQRVRMWVRGADARVRVTAMEGGREIASTPVPAGRAEAVLEWDASSWPLGGYRFVAETGGEAYPAYVVRKISATQRRSLGAWIDADHVFHLEGRPTFPIGFYNTAVTFGKIGDADRARLDAMAEGPVNAQINYTWWTAGLDVRRDYLGEMHRRGMAYFDTVIPVRPGADRIEAARELLPGSGGMLATAEQAADYLRRLAGAMRTLPGHAGWYVMDEAGFEQAREGFDRYALLRSADPDHPAFGVSNKPHEIRFWRDALDVFGLDPYALNNRAVTQAPLSMVGRWTRMGTEATFGSRPVWIVVQFYRHFPQDAWPSREDLRAMSLMAIAEGARGLFYWSYGRRGLSDVADGKARRAYWNDALAVMREIKSLEPALLAPDAPDLVRSVSDPSIRWRARAADGRWTVFAYRPAERVTEAADGAAVDVTFHLKDGREVKRSFRPDGADWFAVQEKAP
ncbi:MAG TPA: hypothetical protein VEJ18_08270 [Planctomycetota bacterium]|nr:hypothetical protein [Planctomycetota bacterium]